MSRICPSCLTRADDGDARCEAHPDEPLLTLAGTDDPRVGTVLDGRYVIVAPLGRGGMGAVYRAWQRTTQREVAVKLTHAGAERGALADRFVREARVTAQLRSLHTVTVYDFGALEDGTLYLVMEHVGGQTLNALRAQTGGRMTPTLAAQLGLQLCDSLAEAHDLGLVHRDIKPANLMVSTLPNGDAHLTVLDFGVVKLLDTERGKKLTRTGSTIGSLVYMSPEQIAGDENIGPASDLYAVGVTLYDLVVGSPPFVAPNALALQLSHATQAPPRLAAGLEDTPATRALDAVVQRCLSKRPEDRFSSARQLADALQGVVDAETGRSGGLATRPPARQRDAKRWPTQSHMPAADPAELPGVTTAAVHQRIHEKLSVVAPPRTRRGLRWSPSTIFAVLAVLIGGFVVVDGITSGDGCAASAVGAEAEAGAGAGAGAEAGAGAGAGAENVGTPTTEPTAGAAGSVAVFPVASVAACETTVLQAEVPACGGKDATGRRTSDRSRHD